MKHFNPITLFNNLIHNKDDILLKLLVTVVFVASLFLITVGQLMVKSRVPEVGSVLYRDYYAHKDLVYVSSEETREIHKKIRLTTPPVYNFNRNLSDRVVESVQTILLSIKNSADYNELGSFLESKSLPLSSGDYEVIKAIFESDDSFTGRYVTALRQLYERGTIKVGTELQANIESSGVIVNKDGRTTQYSLDEILEYELTDEHNKDFINRNFRALTELQRSRLSYLFSLTAVINIEFDKELTELRLQNKLETNVVRRRLKKGQLVALKGEIVNEKNYDMIKSIIDSTNEESSLNLKKLLANFIFIIIFIVLSYNFIGLYKHKFFDIKNLLFFSITIFIFFLYIMMFIYFGADRSNPFFGLYIPISSITLTFIFLYSKTVSAIITVILSVAFFVVTGFNQTSFLFVILSGMFSFFTISEVKKRIELLLAGILIVVLNVIISIFIIMTGDFSSMEMVKYIIFASINGFFSAILAIGIIAIGEIVLNSPTVFRLQELSDASSPILKELFDNAVGTYNHSILVANLAEAAANEIGANGLLARVGGYYHDIGKIDNPEYFIENQGEFNIHTQLKPSISVAIIKNHVKKGVERGKSVRLPQKVLDIIAQHHANSLIKYFYAEALKNNDDDKEEIQKDLFQYKGDIPQFPEAAIVLLADQVEAASRALKKTTMSSVEKLIEGIVDEKFQEGILDDSGLTLKDLTKIKKVFVKLVLGMYHSRIEYPEAKEK